MAVVVIRWWPLSVQLYPDLAGPPQAPLRVLSIAYRSALLHGGFPHGLDHAQIAHALVILQGEGCMWQPLRAEQHGEGRIARGIWVQKM